MAPKRPPPPPPPSPRHADPRCAPPKTRVPTHWSDPSVAPQDFAAIRPPLCSWTPFAAAAPPPPAADVSSAAPRPWHIGAAATEDHLQTSRSPMEEALHTMAEVDRQHAKRRRHDANALADAAGLTLEARWRAEAASSSAASSSTAQAEGDEKPWKKFLNRKERGGRHVKLAKELAHDELAGKPPTESPAASQYRDWSKRHHSGSWKQVGRDLRDAADA